jgi:hypothetical protein
LLSAFGSIWVQSSHAKSLWRISEAGHVQDRITGVSRNPDVLYSGVGGGGLQTLGAGFGSIWTLRGSRVLRIDPATEQVVARGVVPSSSTTLAVGEGAVWVGTSRARLLRIDPTANAVASTSSLGATPAGLAAGLGRLWALNVSEASSVSVIDPADGRVVDNVQVPVRAFVLTAFGRVWLADRSGHLCTLDPSTMRVSNAVRVSASVMGLTAGAGHLWINGGDLTGIDQATRKATITRTAGTLLQVVAPADATAGIAIVGRRAWLAEPTRGVVVAVRI